MKNLRFIIWIAVIVSLKLSAQPSYDYADIFFLDSTNGWILSSQDYLWKTTNAGSTWTSVYDTRIDTLGKLFFINEQNGWMLLNTSLYSSSDGGNSWNFKYEFSQFFGTFDINFINDSVGFISSGSILYRTTDSGQNWDSSMNILGTIFKISFYKESIGFVSSGTIFEYFVHKTTDLGNSWTLSNYFGNLSGCYFGKFEIISENEAINELWYADWVGISVLMKTTDQGNSWGSVGSGFLFTFGLTDFEFTSHLNGWAATQSKSIFRTSNGGVNWDTLHISTTLNENIYNFEFFNSSIAYGITSNHIYYTSDGWETFSIVDSIVTGIYNQELNAFNFTLHQNYPNPFNPSTTIKYELPQSGWISLKVFDVLGREVSMLVGDYSERGKHEITFDASELSSGIYIYKLQSGIFVQSRKMILLK